MTAWFLIPLFLFPDPGSADSKVDLVKADLRALEGEWKPISLRMGASEEVPVEKDTFFNLRAYRVTIRGQKISLTHDKVTDEATLRIDPTRKPKRAEMISADKKHTGKAIYAVEKDTLRIGFIWAGMPRDASEEADCPAAFTDRRALVIRFQRVKPK